MPQNRKFSVVASVVSALAMLVCATAQAAEPADTAALAAEIAPMAERSLLTRVVRAGSRLVAVGARGHILVSDDAQQWRQVAVPVNSLLTAAYFVDAQRGWAVGHDAAILHTEDGGNSWTLQQFQPELNQPLLDVLFLDAQQGYAVGAYGLFLQTQDGGAHWSPLESPIAEEKLHFNALARLGDGGLVVVGEEGMLAVSDDRGATWQRLTSPYESSLFAVLAVGERGALLGGLRGNLYRSEDLRAGPWTRIDLGSTQSVFGLAPLADGSVAVAGLNAMLLRVQADGSVARLAAADAGEAVNARELGALAGVIEVPQGVVTVGDAGVHRWPLANAP